MFEQDNQPINQQNQEGFEAPSYQVSNSLQDDTMHYMPDKFLKPERMEKQGNGLLFKMLIGLLVVGVLAVGGFAFYLYKSKDSGQNNNNQEVLNLEKNQQATSTTENQDLTTASARDNKRVEDIKSIVSAISLYFSENNNYPNSLSDLSDSLKEMPVNPTPGGENYNYTLSLDKKDYKLTFVLESGAEFGNITLNSGKYQITSSGIVELYKEDVGQDDEIDNNGGGNTSDNNDTTNNNSGTLPIPPKGPDTDNDGLTNAEELLFGTEIDKADTDGDTYLDGDEIINLYDPLSLTGKLADNIVITKVFYNESQNYSILYPAKWLAENRMADSTETVFYDDKNGDFFDIHVYENPQTLSLLNWYLSFATGAKADDLVTFNAKKIDGLSTKDGMNIYFSLNNKIYALSYKVLNEEELNYYSTFLMFAGSFRAMQ